jgi:hypothetical protein
MRLPLLDSDNRSEPITPRTLLASVSNRVFSLRQIVLVSVAFVLAVPALHLLMDVINQALFGGSATVSATWPINVFYFHVVWDPLWVFGLTLLAAIGLFAVVVPSVILRDDVGVLPVVVGGAILILATTLIQGYGPGLVTPTAGGYVVELGGIQYYHDAVAIADPVAFLSEYSEQQPELLRHASTHPPGAVLTYYALAHLVGTPALITMAIMLLAVGISGPALYGLLTPSVERRTAQYTSLLYLLLPSIQIYYAGTLDALITAFIIAATYCFVRRPAPSGALGAAFFLFLASFQTFLFLFALPVLFGYEVLRERSIARSVAVSAALALAYGVLYVTFDFNYVQSFLVASAMQNSEGFMLFTQTAKYVTSRAMGVTEILVFFTPFLTWLLVRERRRFWAYRDLFTLFGLAVLAFLALLAAGTYPVGETARAAMYLYPFLMLPLAGYFEDISITDREMTVLAALVFGQTYMMQLAGFYFW